MLLFLEFLELVHVSEETAVFVHLSEVIIRIWFWKEIFSLVQFLFPLLIVVAATRAFCFVLFILITAFRSGLAILLLLLPLQLFLRPFDLISQVLQVLLLSLTETQVLLTGVLIVRV